MTGQEEDSIRTEGKARGKVNKSTSVQNNMRTADEQNNTNTKHQCGVGHVNYIEFREGKFVRSHT